MSSLQVFADFSSCSDASSEQVEETSFIHPSAIVHPNAVIGQVHLPQSWVMLANYIQEATYLETQKLGTGHHAVVGLKCQDKKYNVGLVYRVHGNMGDECFLDVGETMKLENMPQSIAPQSQLKELNLRCGVLILFRLFWQCSNRNNNLIMGSCHIAHDCKVRNNIIFANNTLLETMLPLQRPLMCIDFVILEPFLLFVVSQDVPKYTQELEDCLQKDTHAPQIRALGEQHEELAQIPAKAVLEYASSGIGEALEGIVL
ncbi:hypothetical protein RJ641_026783, partial [Dillenia turbinata]